MGAQQSKDEFLYQQVNYGNVQGIISLHRQGAGLEWVDREGKTPLMVACLRHDLVHVAETLIKLGANVNAYRPGSHAGTPLHHAAKKGLERTVNLLLSNGANPLTMNDDCHTPLDLAREKGNCNVVRAIENRICLFYGWLREHYGPGFLEAFAPQLMSRKIWAVVLPCASRNPMRPPKFELVIYSDLQTAKPRTVISLWKAHVEEPKFNHPDPAVFIVDKDKKTRYKFSSAYDSDKQQLQWFYNACRGMGLPPSNNNIQPTSVGAPLPNGSQLNSNASQSNNNILATSVGAHFPNGSQLNSNASATATVAPTSRSEDVALAMAINASIQSAIAEGVPDVCPITQTTNSNGWEGSSDNSTHNGWGPPSGATPAATNAQARLNEPTGNAYNGWVAPEARQPNIRLNGCSASPSNMSQPPVISSSEEALPSTLAPSAPPIVDEMFYNGPIHYPSIDSSPVDISMPTVKSDEVKESSSGTSGFSKSGTGEVKEGSSTSGTCVICFESPVEGACIPCGHMGGCMACLREIQAKNWGCPVCRAKIDQVIKIYAV